MAKIDENELLKTALQYHERGWCIIPIPQGKKAARIRWKQYQAKRPTGEQVRKWFVGNNRNIAVVLGGVSGGLACRDFDTEQAYQRWAGEHRDLAGKLPTVRTARGYHVYFLADVDGVRQFDDGELRGKGGYCLLPPSVHPDGVIYEWLIETNGENLLSLKPDIFLSSSVSVTEKTEQTEQTEQTKAIVIDEFIEKAIIETLPKDYGTRNRQIFEFARALKSLPQFTEADPKQFRDIVRVWHTMALPKIRTKDFEGTWIDFLKGWPRIKYAKGQEPMAQIFEKAIQLEPPQVAVEKYPDNSKLKILVSLCRELQRAAGENPFFLSVRTAGKLLNVSAMEGSRCLFLLVSDEILKVIAKGGTAENPRKATRFRYIAV